jgi:hypothetical protein
MGEDKSDQSRQHSNIFLKMKLKDGFNKNGFPNNTHRST